MNLVDAWKACRFDEPPFWLDADRQILEAANGETDITRDWQSAYSAPNFADPNDRRFHLGLLPGPYCGDLQKASIYVLLLNPGLGPTDYYGLYEVPRFREALCANLQQEFSTNVFPFLPLDPQFSWHGGFRWWHAKLAGIIDRIAKHQGTPFAEARKFLAMRLASIELVPYHSKQFHGAAWIYKRPSVKLAREFVKNEVMRRVHCREAIVIVARKARRWELDDDPANGLVTYNAGEAQAAHLGPKSRGGKKILEQLGIPVFG